MSWCFGRAAGCVGVCAGGGGGRVSPSSGSSPPWPSEVEALGAMLRDRFGPFLVVGGGTTSTQSRKRGVVLQPQTQPQTQPQPPPPATIRRPLLALEAVLDAARRSAPMAARLGTADGAYEYAMWTSRRLGASPDCCSPAQVLAAEAIAARHGLSEALHLSAAASGGHAWASDEAWIDAYLALGRASSSSSSSGRRREASAQASQASRPPAKRRKRTALPSAVRLAVWNQWNGAESGMGPCFCCGRAVSQQDFECGHVLAAARGGSDAVGNLRPLCRTCNRSMGERHMDEFRAEYFRGGDPPLGPLPPGGHADPSPMCL